MKVSLNWLKKYVDIKEDPETLAADLTMFGLNVESIKGNRPEFSGIVFGKVLECRKHPGADKLSVCKVDAGGKQLLSIVCGAPNVRAGLNVAVAVNGAVLPGNFRIRKTKLRGEVSEGMICSETELGTGSDSSGIIELDFELEPGTDLKGYLGDDDIILDIEVTPNRPDQLSHTGIAREIAALYRREFREPEYFILEPDDRFSINIENGTDCPRYSAAFIDDVKIKPSPQWLQNLLVSTGVKPLNNLVDITNFVLMEMGQPLHAFDRDCIRGDQISVRRAREKEKMGTLDGTIRDLDENILLIVDAEGPIAIAGVMGGSATEIHEGTKRVILESALFDPRAVRRSSHALKLDTEASYRFEREGDIGITNKALERACYLIAETGAGKPQGTFTDKLVDGRSFAPAEISLRIKQANRLMGTHLAADDIVELLGRLQLDAHVSGKDLLVSVPTFRRDLKMEVDLIEEAARVYGYENIGREEDRKGNIFSIVSAIDRMREDTRSFLASRGYAEAVNSSFMDPDDSGRFEWKKNDPRSNPVMLLNPLSASQSALRTSLLPGMLRTLARNAPVEQEGIRMFEMANVFLSLGDGESLPDERLHLTAIFSRRQAPLQWIGEKRDFGFFDMKGEIECLFNRMGVPPDTSIERIRDEEPDYSFNLLYKNNIIGVCGMIPGRVAERYEVTTTTFYFTVFMDIVYSVRVSEPRYTDLIQYPAVKRDLCVVASDRITFSDIRKVVRKRAKFLEFIGLFDYYQGGNLGEGRRSYAFRLTFRSPEGTLKDNVIDKVIEKVLDGLQRELQVILRTE